MSTELEANTPSKKISWWKSENRWWKKREIKFWGLFSCIVSALAIDASILGGSLLWKHQDKGEVIAAILTLCSGLVLAIPGVYITFKRQQVLEDQKNIEHKENKLHEISDRHDRFRLASEQLGKNADKNTPDIPARLGAVISLANLADEWEETNNILQRDVCINMLISYLKIEPTIKNIPFTKFIKNNTDMEFKIDDATVRDEILNQIYNRLPDIDAKSNNNWDDYSYDFSNCFINNLRFISKRINKINLDGIKIFGIVNFYNSIFMKRVYFTQNKFIKHINFNSATFTETVNFSGTTFKGIADFSKTTFESDAFFDNTTFKGNASFSIATFKEEIHFENTIFEFPSFDYVIFLNNTIFESDAFFHNTTFKETVDFSKTILNNKIADEKIVRKLFIKVMKPPINFYISDPNNIEKTIEINFN